MWEESISDQEMEEDHETPSMCFKRVASLYFIT